MNVLTCDCEPGETCPSCVGRVTEEGEVGMISSIDEWCVVSGRGERALKQASVIDLDHLGELMQEYVVQQFPESEQILESIRFSTFLAWLQKQQQEQADVCDERR